MKPHHTSCGCNQFTPVCTRREMLKLSAGGFGMLALALSVLAKVACLASFSSATGLVVLIAAHALSRATIAYPLLAYSPVHADGLGAQVGKPTDNDVWLTIGIGAIINATWLLVGLLRRGSYKPLPGWGKFALQVIAASALLAVLLVWGAQHFDWVEMRGKSWQRIGLLAALMVAAAQSAPKYSTAAGLKLRQMLRR